MPRAPQLISELLSLADAWGWSPEDLARELGIDRTTLLQYRSGRRPLTVRALRRIARRFGEQRVIRDLVWHYLVVEGTDHDVSLAPAQLVGVSPPVARRLQTYVDRFADESLHGRGLYVAAADASALSAALHHVGQLLEAARIPACRLRADRAPSASETRTALAAPVLLIERFDFACDAIRQLVRQRGDLVRPIVLTSMRPPADIDDPYLRRVVTSLTRRVDIEPALSPSPADGPVLVPTA